MLKDQIYKLLKKLGLISKEKYEKRTIKYSLEYKTIAESEYFDKDWYLAEYKDIYKARVDPVFHYLNYGWKEGRNPSDKFDGKSYLTLNPDVKRAKMNPLFHYEIYGRNEGRGISIADIFSIEEGNALSDSKIEEYDVLLIHALRETDGVYLWRTLFLKENLENGGLSVKIIHIENNKREIKALIDACKCVIINRLKFRSEHIIMSNYIRQKGKFLIGDIDDLLSSTSCIYSGRFKSKLINYRPVKNACLTHENAFLFVDAISVSTPSLKDQLQKTFNKEIVLSTNKINQEFTSLDISNKTACKDRDLKLLYASGSSTHDFDFSRTHLSLLNFMLKHKDVSLSILGTSSAFKAFEFFEDRVNYIGRLSFDEMLKCFGEYDILLVPLDENIFNDAKSNIKYIEAGIVGTPVVASPCAEFKSAIKHGKNGFLFSQDNALEVLEEIYEKRDSLIHIGKNARNDIIKNKTTATPSNDLIDLIKANIC